MRTNKETHQSIIRKLFIVKIFSKLAIFGNSSQKVLLKIGVPKMWATEIAIFRKSYFERTPLTGCYCILLKCLEPEPLVFENIANHSADFITNAQSRTFSIAVLTRIFCGISNLQYLILQYFICNILHYM